MASDENTTIHNSWEREFIKKLAFDALQEQRRRRRWSIFFKIVLFLWLFLILFLIWPTDSLPTPGREKTHVALIQIDGIIDEAEAANQDDIIASLQAAFKDKNAQAIILSINSPGGSPVQAANVYDELRYLEKKNPKTKVYAVCGDLCTSAAYYIAAAANNIYANQASLVGSIGVLMDGFGFVDTMQKLGVQRRLITSGNHKGFLDPFSPMNPQEQQYAQSLLDNVHQVFIDSVKQGRGNRLKTTADTFSGLVWTGTQAFPQGLIDGFGSVASVARDVIKNENIVDYTVKQNVFEQMAHKLGSIFTQEIAAQWQMQNNRLL